MTTPSDKAYMQKYRAEHADDIRASGKAWRDLNRETLLPKKREKARVYRELFPDKVKSSDQRTYAKHREKRIAHVAKWVKENPKRTSETQRRCSLMAKYGITPEQWQSMFASQGNRCGICKRVDVPGKRGWHTDHDHATGRVRGILCHHCNMMLGGARDCRIRLLAAVDYLMDKPE